jgi:biopolymer transport protein ExbB
MSSVCKVIILLVIVYLYSFNFNGFKFIKDGSKMNIRLSKIISSFLLLCFVGFAAPMAFADDPAPPPEVTAAVAADKAAGEAKTTAVSNPYGIDALWKQGDFVSRGTLIILAIMSFGTWYIGVVKYFEQAKLLKHAKETNNKFWQANSIPAGIAGLNENSAFRYLAESASSTAGKHDVTINNRVDFSTWLDMGIQRAITVISNRLQGGLSFLATVGSTAPFVGLFGTVWGIYHALTAIGMSGQASIDKVAGPVGEALIMTAMGLAVAVPAVLGYNWLVRRNKVVMEQVRHFSAELHMSLLGAGNK